MKSAVKLVTRVTPDPAGTLPPVVSAVSRTTSLADLPEYLRIDECAVWLDIGLGTAYALARSGELRTVKLGTRILRVPRAAFIEFVTGPATQRGGR